MSTQVTVTPEQPVDVNMEKAIAEAKAAQPVEETPQRPEWLPEKFKAPEELAKAYSELEKKFSAPDKPKETTTQGLDFTAYTQEFAEKGELSADSIQKLVSSGIPESLIANYVEGVKALGEMQTQKVYGLAGGESQYQTMMEWASENLEESEIDAYNRIMEAGDYSSIQIAVKGLQARYTQVNGQPAKLIQGEVSGPSGGIFRSVAEVTAAMKDPRYAKDPAYRRDVENRLKNSNILGVTSR